MWFSKKKKGKEIDMADESKTTQTPPAVDPPKEEFVQIKKEDWDGVQDKLKRLDVFEQRFSELGTPAQPAAPAPPPGPTMDEQLADVDKEISAMDADVDKAVEEGKGVAALLKKRDALLTKKNQIMVDSRVGELSDRGFSTIDQLSDIVMKGQMPYLDVVKGDYDKIIASMPQAARANPQARLLAYNNAVGQNVDKITTLEREKALREGAATTQTTPGAPGREVVDGGDKAPKPEEVLSAENLEAIHGLGFTVDEYYKRMKGKTWAEHYEESKEYYEGGGQ